MSCYTALKPLALRLLASNAHILQRWIVNTQESKCVLLTLASLENLNIERE